MVFKAPKLPAMSQVPAEPNPPPMFGQQQPNQKPKPKTTPSVLGTLNQPTPAGQLGSATLLGGS